MQVDTGHYAPTLAVLSPGPGSPTDFKLSWTISEMMERKIPIFGVCLGLQVSATAGNPLFHNVVGART